MEINPFRLKRSHFKSARPKSVSRLVGITLDIWLDNGIITADEICERMSISRKTLMLHLDNIHPIKGGDMIFPSLCDQEGLPMPYKEVPFAAATHKRWWRADWLFIQGRSVVALEVEGGVHTKGRHTRPSGFMKDMEKYNAMSELGILLVRTTPSDLLKKGTLDAVKGALESNEKTARASYSLHNYGQ